MRVLACLLALSLGAATQALSTLRHSHHSRSHGRTRSHAAMHAAVHADPPPCGAGRVRVFEPQLGCAQVSSPKEAVDLVVVTESTCKEVLQGIRTKTAPYWDPEMNRCADETRTGLLTQCAQKIGSNFSVSLQGLCHFDTKVLDSAFHSVKIVPALPAVEVPTGAFVPGQLVQKRTEMSMSREAALNANTHADPKTPAKPNDKWAEYPTALTASAQKLAHIAQESSGCIGAGNVRVPCGSLAPGHNLGSAAIASFTYKDVKAAPQMAATPDDPVIVGTADHAGSSSVRTVSPDTAVPAGAIKVKPAASSSGGGSTAPSKDKEPVPNPAWARFPSGTPTAAATSMAISSQRAQGVLPGAPTMITIQRVE